MPVEPPLKSKSLVKSIDSDALNSNQEFSENASEKIAKIDENSCYPAGVTPPSNIRVEFVHETTRLVSVGSDFTLFVFGKTVGDNVFIATDAKVDPRAISKIGPGTNILAGSIGPEVLLGRECIVLGHLRGKVIAGNHTIFGPNSRIHAGVFGDQVLIGSQVLSGPEVIVGNHVEIGDSTSLARKVLIRDYVCIGKNCAIESSISGTTEIGRGAIIGNYCDTDDDPLIPEKTLIPPHSLLIGTNSSKDATRGYRIESLDLT
ncbi:MAG: hypothetical protein KDD53_06570 [Bdellovibrionales bacterium]|nr:hypothetical protein [Bdellovibrionales bacterium]